MKRYGVVVIGCGHIGRQHLEDIYYRKEIRLVGVVDRDPDTAEDCRRRYGAQSCGVDYLPYLERSDVDIVLIATYTSSHLEILQRALAAGKHVLCEKPVGVDLAEAQAFLAAAEGSDRKVLVGHILRYNDTYIRAANLIHSGLIGQVKVMRMVQNHHSLNWDRYRRLLRDATPILDCGVHYFDVMQWFTGSKITGVSAFGARIDPDLPEDQMNYGAAAVRLASGAVGYYEAGWSPALNSANLKEIVGEKGSIQIILNPYRATDVEEGDLIRVHLRERDEYRAINVPAKYRNMWGQLRHLIRMIREDLPPCPTHQEVYEAFRVAWEAQRQMRQGLFAPLPGAGEPAAMPNGRAAAPRRSPAQGDPILL